MLPSQAQSSINSSFSCAVQPFFVVFSYPREVCVSRISARRTRASCKRVFHRVDFTWTGLCNRQKTCSTGRPQQFPIENKPDGGNTTPVAEQKSKRTTHRCHKRGREINPGHNGDVIVPRQRVCRGIVHRSAVFALAAGNAAREGPSRMVFFRPPPQKDFPMTLRRRSRSRFCCVFLAVPLLCSASTDDFHYQRRWMVERTRVHLNRLASALI